MNYDSPKTTYIKPFIQEVKKGQANNHLPRKPVENTDWGRLFVSATGTANSNASATISNYTYAYTIPSQGVIPEVENEQQHKGNVMEEITFPKPKNEKRG